MSGRSLTHAELIGRGGGISSTFQVLVEREATLDESLARVESRSLRCITVVIHPGFDDARVVKLSRTDARLLSEALGTAWAQTADDGEGRTS